MNDFLLAFDFGTKNIGVAVGQKITNTAHPLRPIKVQTCTFNWKPIEYLFKEWQPSEVIVGLPLSIDGSEQPITSCTRKFAKEIRQRFCMVVKLHDERLSTVEARSNLFEQGGFHLLKKKKNVDSISAAVILESYLANFNNP